MKKDKVQIIFLQETRENSQKRGVATLISNNLNFKLIKENGDKQGRYRIVKGRIDNILVTFANIYASPRER